jgi:hypothetical protein
MRNAFWVIVFAVALAGTGCSSMKEEVLPVHDEVLIYNLPYDLMFLRTLEALESVEGWELEETDKEKGLIVVRNINFSSFNDADKRAATFVLRRVNRQKTSVALTEASQRVVDGDLLLKKIGEFLGRER